MSTLHAFLAAVPPAKQTDRTERWFPADAAACDRVLTVERKGEVLFHRRPFAGDHRIDNNVAQSTVRADLVAAQDAVHFRAEARGAAPARAGGGGRAGGRGEAGE